MEWTHTKDQSIRITHTYVCYSYTYENCYMHAGYSQRIEACSLYVCPTVALIICSNGCYHQHSNRLVWCDYVHAQGTVFTVECYGCAFMVTVNVQGN